MDALDKNFIATYQILTPALYLIGTMKTTNCIIICYQFSSDQILLVYHSHKFFIPLEKGIR